MATRKTLKEMAKKQLGNAIFNERWLYMLLTCLIMEILLGVVSGSFPYSKDDGLSIVRLIFNVIFIIASLLVTGPLQYGIARVMTRAAREDEKADLNGLFTGFTECFGDAVLLGFMKSLLIALWTLLLIIPGIVKSYSYALASYIQQDEDNKDWNYCIKKSMKMMKGHKWDLFVLDLSFIGWYIVGFLCLAIGTLWVTPYHQMTRTNFYIELKKCLEGEPKTIQELVEEDAFEEVDFEK